MVGDGTNNGRFGGREPKRPAWSTENGSSILFDGTDDYAQAPDTDALDVVGNKVTISCWVKRSGATSGNLVEKADSSNGYRLWITSGGNRQFELLIGGTTHTVTSASTIPLNEWKHLCAR